MADLQGTIIAATVLPTSDQDTFATHEARWGKGSYRTVSSLVERDAISDERRELGMLVWVDSEKTLYRLTEGVTNADWENLGNGSSTATYEPVAAKEWTLKAEILNNDIEDLRVYMEYDPQVVFDSEGDVVMAKVQY